MIETITNFANWYWPQAIWANMSFVIGGLMFIVYFVLSAWKGKPLIPVSDEDEPVIYNMFIASLAFFLLGLFVAVTFPIVVLGLILCVLYYFINSWGNSYRKVVQSQEAKRLSALAQLIKDDPDVKKAYDKLMEEKSLNINS